MVVRIIRPAACQIPCVVVHTASKKEAWYARSTSSMCGTREAMFLASHGMSHLRFRAKSRSSSERLVLGLTRAWNLAGDFILPWPTHFLTNPTSYILQHSRPPRSDTPGQVHARSHGLPSS